MRTSVSFVDTFTAQRAPHRQPDVTITNEQRVRVMPSKKTNPLDKRAHRNRRLITQGVRFFFVNGRRVEVLKMHVRHGYVDAKRGRTVWQFWLHELSIVG